MRWLPVLTLALTACSGDPPPPSTARAAAMMEPAPGVIRIAGSGALSPLLRSFAAEWSRRRGASPRIVVEESLGSGGGVLAAADGAVDLGMISRALTVDERRLGLREFEVALDVVVIAANPEVPVSGLSSPELRALLTGESRRFADGSPATVLLRDRGESANGALDRAVPGLAEVREGAYARGRMRVIYHDSAMVEALAATSGAIGVTSLGVLGGGRSSLKVLALDDRIASVQALADGSWPATRRLALVMRSDRVERVQPLLDLIASEEGAALTRAAGYLPLTGRVP